MQTNSDTSHRLQMASALPVAKYLHKHTKDGGISMQHNIITTTCVVCTDSDNH